MQVNVWLTELGNYAGSFSDFQCISALILFIFGFLQPQLLKLGIPYLGIIVKVNGIQVHAENTVTKFCDVLYLLMHEPIHPSWKCPFGSSNLLEYFSVRRFVFSVIVYGHEYELDKRSTHHSSTRKESEKCRGFLRYFKLGHKANSCFTLYG